MSPRSSRPRRSGALALLGMSVAVLSGCLVLTEGSNYGIGFETTRANVVVYKAATGFLYANGRANGSRSSRQILAAATPSEIHISRTQRAGICAISVALCLSAPQIGRVVVSWFKDDVLHRSDFWEALSYAGSHHRCFAWTFIPSRNLTHKGTGTAGCTTGTVK